MYGLYGEFYLMDVFHVVYTVICASLPILLVLHLKCTEETFTTVLYIETTIQTLHAL